MFRALYAHHREVEILYAASGIVTLSKWPSGAHLCTGRPLTESDNIRCCINTIHLPDDEHIMLETCRGL